MPKKKSKTHRKNINYSNEGKVLLAQSLFLIAAIALWEEYFYIQKPTTANKKFGLDCAFYLVAPIAHGSLKLYKKCSKRQSVKPFKKAVNITSAAANAYAGWFFLDYTFSIPGSFGGLMLAASLVYVADPIRRGAGELTSLFCNQPRWCQNDLAGQISSIWAKALSFIYLFGSCMWGVDNLRNHEDVIHGLGCVFFILNACTGVVDAFLCQREAEPASGPLLGANASSVQTEKETDAARGCCCC